MRSFSFLQTNPSREVIISPQPLSPCYFHQLGKTSQDYTSRVTESKYDTYIKSANMFQNTLALFLQFFFFALAFAQPIETAGHGNAWKYGSGGGVIGFIVLILDIIVFSMSPLSLLSLSVLFLHLNQSNHLSPVEVLKSNRPPSHKLLWCLVVFLFPILGLVIYWLFSNRQAHNSGSGSYEAIP